MKKMICILLMLALCFGAAAPAFASSTPSFSDVPSTHWAYGSIQTMADMGIVGGIGGGKFDPNGKVSTAQFAAMIVRAFYADEQEGKTSNIDKWWAIPMRIAFAHDIIFDTAAGKTYKTDNFSGAETWDIALVEAPMSRADMAIALVGTMEGQRVTMPSAAELEATKTKIADYNSIDADHKDAVTIAYHLGLLKGVDTKGSFNPNGSLTRAEACAVMERMMQQMGMIESKPVVTEPTTPAEPAKPDVPADNGGVKEGCLANGQPITEENIKAVLEELKEKYPERMKWGMDDTYSSPAIPRGWNNYACAGFAWMIMDGIFGTDPQVNPYYEHKNFDKLKVGDVVLTINSSTGYNHAVVVTEVDYATDFFRGCSGNSGGEVTWLNSGYPSRYTSKADLSGSCILSRY